MLALRKNSKEKNVPFHGSLILCESTALNWLGTGLQVRNFWPDSLIYCTTEHLKERKINRKHYCIDFGSLLHLF